jgi:hypothetical protein
MHHLSNIKAMSKRVGKSALSMKLFIAGVFDLSSPIDKIRKVSGQFVLVKKRGKCLRIVGMDKAIEDVIGLGMSGGGQRMTDGAKSGYSNLVWQPSNCGSRRSDSCRLVAELAVAGAVAVLVEGESCVVASAEAADVQTLGSV